MTINFEKSVKKLKKWFLVFNIVQRASLYFLIGTRIGQFYVQY